VLAVWCRVELTIVGPPAQDVAPLPAANVEPDDSPNEVGREADTQHPLVEQLGGMLPDDGLQQVVIQEFDALEALGLKPLATETSVSNGVSVRTGVDELRRIATLRCLELGSEHATGRMWPELRDRMAVCLELHENLGDNHYLDWPGLDVHTTSQSFEVLALIVLG